MKELHVGIVGATGMVGQEFIKILDQRHFPVASIHLFASDKSAGKSVTVRQQKLTVQETSEDSFKGLDLVFFSAGTDVSKHFAPFAARAGAVVVDNSAAFRMDPDTPLVVPEINPEDCEHHHGIIANPNCSTIQMVVVLYPLHKVNPIKRVIVDTYQSVSGTGLPAVEELKSTSRAVLDGKPAEPHVYPHQIAFNMLPEIDVFMENGYTKEEWKMVTETRKIMHAPDIAISATCVRVPSLIGHSEAVHVEFTRPMSPGEARRILTEAPGVKVQDEPTAHVYPMPWTAAGQDDTFVGRIREDASHPNGLAMWICADNVRKGAALNGLQIAEAMMERGWL
ncbi:MAG: aspartate-semialdehyde dehydrogenase [Chloroflexota bacterium]|nr:MAG: aspartate-semialdehyde dehydrogenase [Chloroflexota bacterium]